MCTGLPGPGFLHTGRGGGLLGKPPGETLDVSPQHHSIFSHIPYSSRDLYAQGRSAGH